jgi:hypothetical protein
MIMGNKRQVQSAFCASRQFIIGGEVLLLVFRGICDCDTLQSGKHDEEVRLYSFSEIIAV